MKSLIKTLLVYTFLFLMGTSAGYGVVLAYNKLSEPEVVLIGNYNHHFEGTDKKVIMYGTDWCPVCERAREFFNNEGISYKEVNPEKDESVFKLYSQLGASGYPIIVIGNKRVFGLDTKEIKVALTEI
ncbi:glutaredoxin family protein [Shewanella woodyi]|uniref:Glutaredoxin n=1 Tax=Shewanella woodyi (strain ATCC 51908 / MS32) TaxID=392500 RepID=B1KH43_SHEWM|nr:glutaredoxin family protein [Shewanella woodyi]ACA88355.1 glutaredoxin [Shewanella woodyi ATCC 51908]